MVNSCMVTNFHWNADVILGSVNGAMLHRDKALIFRVAQIINCLVWQLKNQNINLFRSTEKHRI